MWVELPSTGAIGVGTSDDVVATSTTFVSRDFGSSAIVAGEGGSVIKGRTGTGTIEPTGPSWADDGRTDSTPICDRTVETEGSGLPGPVSSFGGSST